MGEAGEARRFELEEVPDESAEKARSAQGALPRRLRPSRPSPFQNSSRSQRKACREIRNDSVDAFCEPGRERDPSRPSSPRRLRRHLRRVCQCVPMVSGQPMTIQSLRRSFAEDRLDSAAGRREQPEFPRSRSSQRKPFHDFRDAAWLPPCCSPLWLSPLRGNCSRSCTRISVAVGNDCNVCLWTRPHDQLGARDTAGVK